MKDVLAKIKKEFLKLPKEIHKHYLPDIIENNYHEFRWLLAFGKVICPGYRFHWPQLDWWDDQEFTDYLVRFNEEHGMNTFKRWNLLQYLKQITTVEGDTVECGSYTGASSYLILRENMQSPYPKMHFIFDSFEGLSEPEEIDGDHWSKNDLVTTEQELVKNIKEFEGGFKTFKGWIPTHFEKVAQKEFSFVHIDVDLYQPTFDSIAFFYPRLNPGGIIICDDYGFSACPGATKAIDEFMHDKPEELFLPASGTCVIVKQ
jgi:predicted O-methyltransferase YrrM